MTSRDRPPLSRTLPRLPAAILGRLLPRAERAEVLADLGAEYTVRVATQGTLAARGWIWRQALGSAPALLGWSWWRDYTGFEPHANAFRPGGPMLRTWITDARYAGRRLRVRPSYTLIAVLTLALGIGGTAAVFGIARPVIFDDLPYANANEVGALWMPGWWTEEEFLYLRGKFPGFRLMAAHRPSDVSMREGEAPARLLPGIQTSWELFDVLGARPLIGRGFRQGDDVAGAEPVAVISYGLWQELGGSPSILGKRLTIEGDPRTVIGVMPRGFWYPTPDIRIWLTKPLDPEGRNGSYELVGRVTPGVDVRHLDAQVKRLTTIIGERFQYAEKADKTKNASIITLREKLLGKLKPALVATFVAMGLILLIACVNVAALMLGQIEGRASELAVRSALGATRGRLAQQIVIEALILGLVAGVAGGALAAIGFSMLAHALPIGAWAENAAFDWSTFIAALAIAVLAVLLVVLVPMFSLWRGDLRGALSRARTGGIQGRGGRLERGLVIAEVALAMLITSGAALLVRSVSNLYAIDPGVDTRGIAVISVLTPREMRSAERRQKVDELVAALEQLPLARSVAAGMKMPLQGGGDSFGISVEGGQQDESKSFTYFRFVTPSWFETMGIRVKSGRTFTNADRPNTDLVVVINEALAKQYFPGQNPIGRRIGGGLRQWWTVIGVVENVAEGALTDEAPPARYYSSLQAPWFSNAVSIAIRTKRAQDDVAILDAARRTVQRLAPTLPVQTTTTMSRVMDTAVGPARQIMALLTLLATLALVLGAVGIYGVISHFAARRQRDWAIRVALGLTSHRVVRHILGQGVGLAVVGVLVGAVGTVALARLLATFLFNVGRIDVIAFGAASVALLAIGALAAFVPARRAATVDPALVLRQQ